MELPNVLEHFTRENVVAFFDNFIRGYDIEPNRDICISMIDLIFENITDDIDIRSKQEMIMLVFVKTVWNPSILFHMSDQFYRGNTLYNYIYPDLPLPRDTTPYRYLNNFGFLLLDEDYDPVSNMDVIYGFIHKDTLAQICKALPQNAVMQIEDEYVLYNGSFHASATKIDAHPYYSARQNETAVYFTPSDLPTVFTDDYSSYNNILLILLGCLYPRINILFPQNPHRSAMRTFCTMFRDVPMPKNYNGSITMLKKFTNTMTSIEACHARINEKRAQMIHQIVIKTQIPTIHHFETSEDDEMLLEDDNDII